VARVLVIDDEAPLRESVRAALVSAGYEVIEAADADSGLRLYREKTADLVVVDLFMPGRDGLEFIRDLRTKAPNAKIIAMSGGRFAERIDLLYAAEAFGAARTLSKPFKPEALLAAIRELLGVNDA
jgi:DNA-binding response OmpR family regulator